MKLILTQAEIDDLTAFPDGRHRQHLDARRRVLDELGLTYKVVGRNQIIVSRMHFEAVMAGKPELELIIDNEQPDRYEVDFEALARLGHHGKSTHQS